MRASQRIESSSKSPIRASPQATDRVDPPPDHPQEAESHFAKCDRASAVASVARRTPLSAPLAPSSPPSWAVQGVASGAAFACSILMQLAWITRLAEPTEPILGSLLGTARTPVDPPRHPRPSPPKAGSHFAKCDRASAATAARLSPPISHRPPRRPPRRPSRHAHPLATARDAPGAVSPARSFQPTNLGLGVVARHRSNTRRPATAPTA